MKLYVACVLHQTHYELNQYVLKLYIAIHLSPVTNAIQCACLTSLCFNVYMYHMCCTMHSACTFVCAKQINI